MRILVDQKRARRSFDPAANYSQAGDSDVQGGDDSSFFGPPPTSDRSSSKPSRRGGRASTGAACQVPGPSAQGSLPADSCAMVKDFVQQMVLGCALDVAGPKGLQQVRCSMNTDLSAIHITASDGSKRAVLLSQVKIVHRGSEAAKLGLSGVAIDSLCATVELSSGDCVTFRFPDIEQRNRFAFCIQTFADAHRK